LYLMVMNLQLLQKWSNNRSDSYPLPFYLLELGEVVLQNLFGYILEGDVDSSQIEPEDIPLLRFKDQKRHDGNSGSEVCQDTVISV
jgi:hypothetical protein